jgi:hypothetical protein
MFNLAIFTFYTLPIATIPALHWNTWSADVQKRPYFTQNICGPGNTYACPSSGIPINKGDPDSARIGPRGTIIAPKGVPKVANS